MFHAWGILYALYDLIYTAQHLALDVSSSVIYLKNYMTYLTL
jgi:hypothetical protein